MLAKLFIHPQDLDRENLIIDEITKHGLTISHPDVLFFSHQDKLSVEKVRTIFDFLKLKPLSSQNKIIAISCAHDLSETSQNTLLKSLEETPGNALFILGASTEAKLLPTVISRCEVIKFNEPELIEKNNLDLTEKFINQPLPERFQTIEGLKDKESFFADLIIFLRNQMYKNESHHSLAKIALIMEQYAKQNVSLRAILEYLALCIPEPK